MSQQRQFRMLGGGSHPGQYNDTTYTKIFVGGLAWETKRDTMSRYFEQFGDILEAVVITDKNTGRSKGYGFVTFKDPEAAMRACQNPSPVIDGRRTNCNIASLGAQKTRPPTPRHGVGRFRSAHGAHHGSSSTYIQQQTGQYLIPYSAYGYAGYSQDIIYPLNYYNLYGGQQFSPYYPTGALLTPRMFQNIYQFDPQMAQQYPYLPQQLSSTGIISPSSSMPTAASTTPAALGDCFQPPLNSSTTATSTTAVVATMATATTTTAIATTITEVSTIEITPPPRTATTIEVVGEEPSPSQASETHTLCCLQDTKDLSKGT